GERAQHLLRILIESYIRDGQPVGSRALSRESGLQLSSATVRNVMADLEQLGFVASPHTSAGRVPTDKGYRFFVDSLLRLRPLDEVVGAELRRAFETSRESSTDLIATVSELLSRATHLAGVVTLPRTRQAAITQIEFVGLSENRVLVVLVFNDREVQNRVIQLERHFSPDELKRASNYLNEQFRGRSLPEARQEILRQLSEAHAHMNQIMLEAISVAQQVFESGAGESRLEYVIKGETNLMGVADLTSVEKLRRLFEAFNEKRDFLHLLDQSPAREPPAVPPETGAELVELERLQQALAESEERARSHREQYLRALAELDNVRKRAQRDIEAANRYGLEKFAAELLPVKDSL